MITNDQMTAGRFLRWHKARKRVAAIQTALRSGRAVALGSYTRPVIYDDASHADLFRATKSGAYIKRGKGWDCIDFTEVRFSR